MRNRSFGEIATRLVSLFVGVSPAAGLLLNDLGPTPCEQSFSAQRYRILKMSAPFGRGRNSQKGVSVRRVLVFPGSTLVAKEIVDSLVSLPGYQVFGAGYDVAVPWLTNFQDYRFLPPLGDPKFLQELQKVVVSLAITHVIPANEVAILTLPNVMRFVEAQLVSHPEKSTFVVCSKRRTLKAFRGSPFFPGFFDADNPPTRYPVFFKPDFGHSSIGTGHFEDRASLDAAVLKGFSLEENVITEMLPGREVTVDCLSTLQRGLLFAKPRLRSSVDRGTSAHTVDFQDERLLEIAHHINARLDFNGAWFFQAKESAGGDFKVLEIGARIAGASALRRAQGVNLSHLSVLVGEGVDVVIRHSELLTEARTFGGTTSFSGNIAFSRLYVDLDDTLVLNDELNSPVLDLVREAVRVGAWTAVITRASYDPVSRLEKLGVSRLFREVIHLQDRRPKQSFIRHGANSILIDDSFRERKECGARSDILSVDASAASGLRGLLVRSL